MAIQNEDLWRCNRYCYLMRYFLYFSFLVTLKPIPISKMAPASPYSEDETPIAVVVAAHIELISF